MQHPGPVEPSQPSQSPAGGPSRGPLPYLDGEKPHARTRAEELQAIHRATIRALFHQGMGRDRIPYRILRGLGATTMETLETLLRDALPNPISQVFVLATYLPGHLDPDSLWGILRRYQIHPLSLVLHLEDHRRALRVLRRLGLLGTYGRWIAPWGLQIKDEPDLERLPPGLVIDGEARIEDCPRLVDLGENLAVVGGTVLIRRCASLERLPDGLTTTREGHIALIDCPSVQHLGARTTFEGVLFVEGCLRFTDLHLVQRNRLEAQDE